jgi:hypothetical protein
MSLADDAIIIVAGDGHTGMCLAKRDATTFVSS